MDDVGELLGTTRPPGPVIYIGLQGAHIVEVTRESLEYIDQQGHSCAINLEQCNENWCRYVEQHRSQFIIFPGVTQEELEEENATMVAGRGTRYVQFFDAWKTRFEFASNEERWKLEGALLRVGWRTFDRD
jgi:hypothetical protein